MSRRPATCLSLPCLAALAALMLAGCGGKEAPAPPPAASSSAPALAPQPTPVPAAAPSEQAPAPEQPAAAPVPAAAAPVEAPPAPTPDPNAKPSEKPVDPLQWLQDSEARKADYQRRLAEAEGQLADARPQVELWQKNLLSFKNPFLPPAKLTQEEADALAGKDGVARVKYAEDRLAQAQAALDTAQKKLDDLKANPPQ